MACFAAGLYVAVVSVNDGANHAQAEAETTLRAALVPPIEAIPDARQVFG